MDKVRRQNGSAHTPVTPTRALASPRAPAYTRCLRCAGAPRRPASGSGLSLLIPSWHAVLSDPGESNIECSRASMPTWPSPFDHQLGTPKTPAIRSTRVSHFVASLVRFRYGLPSCSPPCTDQTGTPQPSGTFTSRLSTDRSPSPSLDITTTVTGLLLLAGLSPAGLAASLAARSNSRDKAATGGHSARINEMTLVRASKGRTGMSISAALRVAGCVAVVFFTAPAMAQENYENWPVLRSTFPSTGGGG